MKSKVISLPFKVKKPVLGLGSQLKNTLCFMKGSRAFLSRIHPDLSSPQDLADFDREAVLFLGKKPKAIACDLHPGYSSSQYIPQALKVQHHHAHIASCMAENMVKSGKVIGVAFDGTGLGDEGSIWGAEFLVCSYKSYKRAAHLKEVPLVGGEAAILEPWRLVCAWLGFPAKLDKSGKLKKAYLSRINAPLASSMGRLFDAAGSIILNKRSVNLEAELAIRLEEKASRFKGNAEAYKFGFSRRKGMYIIDPLPALKQIILDLAQGRPKENTAYRFHLTVASMISRACLAIRRESGVNKVAISGGVFQNKLLLRLASDLLYKEGFKVLTHRQLSCNDSCVSLGQAAVAHFNSR